MAAKKNGAGKASFDVQVQKIAAAVDGAAAAFAALGLPGLTAEQRHTSMGRLRVGEAAAMEVIFDAMDAFPGVFGALAAKDGGVDPKKVETAPARAALAHAEALAPLAEALKVLDQKVADAIMASAQAAKEVSVPAYAIGKASAATDAEIGSAMAPALDFYGHVGLTRKLKAKRAATKTKKAAKAKAAPVAG
jgi:hypothetical protein